MENNFNLEHYLHPSYQKSSANYLTFISTYPNVKYTKTVDSMLETNNNSPQNRLNNLKDNNLEQLKKRRKKNEQKENIYQTFEPMNLIEWSKGEMSTHQSINVWSNQKHLIKKSNEKWPKNLISRYSNNQNLILDQKSVNFKKTNLLKNDDVGQAEQVEEDDIKTTQKPEFKSSNCEDNDCNEDKKPTNKQNKTKNLKSNRLKVNRIKMSTTPSPDFIPDSMLENQNNLIDHRLPHRNSIPFLAKFLIFLVVFTLIATIFHLCLKKWFKKFWRSDRTRASGLAMAGNKLDMKNVQLLGQAYKEKVCFLR